MYHLFSLLLSVGFSYYSLTAFLPFLVIVLCLHHPLLPMSVLLGMSAKVWKRVNSRRHVKTWRHSKRTTKKLVLTLASSMMMTLKNINRRSQLLLSRLPYSVLVLLPLLLLPNQLKAIQPKKSILKPFSQRQKNHRLFFRFSLCNALKSDMYYVINGLIRLELLCRLWICECMSEWMVVLCLMYIYSGFSKLRTYSEVHKPENRKFDRNLNMPLNFRSRKNYICYIDKNQSVLQMVTNFSFKLIPSCLTWGDTFWHFLYALRISNTNTLTVCYFRYLENLQPYHTNKFLWS